VICPGLLSSARRVESLTRTFEEEENPPEKQRDQMNRDGSDRIGGFLDRPLAKVEAVDSGKKVDLLWR
jgi:hypothetical protein